MDNCSTDGSVEFIRKNYPQVTIIQNQEALGFGENNNKGVLAAHGEYIAVINPDIIIKGDALCQMLTFAQKNPDVGIIVPQLLNPDGSLQRSVRRYIDVKSLVSRGMTKGKDSANNEKVKAHPIKSVASLPKYQRYTIEKERYVPNSTQLASKCLKLGVE